MLMVPRGHLALTTKNSDAPGARCGKKSKIFPRFLETGRLKAKTADSAVSFFVKCRVPGAHGADPGGRPRFPPAPPGITPEDRPVPQQRVAVPSVGSNVPSVVGAVPFGDAGFFPGDRADRRRDGGRRGGDAALFDGDLGCFGGDVGFGARDGGGIRRATRAEPVETPTPTRSYVSELRRVPWKARCVGPALRVRGFDRQVCNRHHLKMARTCDPSRRSLIIGAGVGALAAALPRSAEAALGCRDFADRRVCAAGLPSHLAHIRAQEQNQWCWAACISMIFGYYGHPVSQARIVKETFGTIVNMPGTPAQILRALNRLWVDDWGNSFRAGSNFGNANVVQAAQDLAQNQPLIVGTHGHAMVLSSLEYFFPVWATPHGPVLGPAQVTNAVVRDPWMDRARRSLSPNEWHGIMFAAQVRVF